MRFISRCFRPSLPLPLRAFSILIESLKMLYLNVFARILFRVAIELFQGVMRQHLEPPWYNSIDKTTLAR